MGWNRLSGNFALSSYSQPAVQYPALEQLRICCSSIWAHPSPLKLLCTLNKIFLERGRTASLAAKSAVLKLMEISTCTTKPANSSVCGMTGTEREGCQVWSHRQLDGHSTRSLLCSKGVSCAKWLSVRTNGRLRWTQAIAAAVQMFPNRAKSPCHKLCSRWYHYKVLRYNETPYQQIRYCKEISNLEQVTNGSVKKKMVILWNIHS